MPDEGLSANCRSSLVAEVRERPVRRTEENKAAEIDDNGGDQVGNLRGVEISVDILAAVGNVLDEER